jgi:hypothetical protein
MKKRARVIEQDRQSCWTTLLSGIYSNVRQVRSNERKRKFKKRKKGKSNGEQEKQKPQRHR